MDLSTTPPFVQGKCPDETWESYGSKCFLFEPDQFRTWSEAHARCVASGGKLASVHSESEMDFIYQRMLKKAHLPDTRNFWLGGRKVGISKFTCQMSSASISF